MRNRPATNISSSDHELYRTNSALKNKRLEEIEKLVDEQGLQAFYDRMDEFGIGVDFYLHARELNKIFSREEQKKEFSLFQSDAKEQDAREHPEVREANGRGMPYLEKVPFESWEETVFNRPGLTFIPRSKQGLQNLVTWAAKDNQRIRAAGYRHTSSEGLCCINQVVAITEAA